MQSSGGPRRVAQVRKRGEVSKVDAEWSIDQWDDDGRPCSSCGDSLDWEVDDLPKSEEEALCHECRGRLEERAAIVHYLRAPYSPVAWADAANRIERGEHLKPEVKQ